jgi:hypothetical protein
MKLKITNGDRERSRRKCYPLDAEGRGVIDGHVIRDGKWSPPKFPIRDPLRLVGTREQEYARFCKAHDEEFDPHGYGFDVLG